MEYEETLEKIKFFVKTGIIVLSVLVLIVLGVQYLPSAIYVTNSANSTKLPIYSVDNNNKMISLSFDLTGGNKDIEKILEILALHNIKTTFFMTGEWIQKYPDEVKAIAANGHDLGNNTETHPNMSQLTRQEIIEEILTAHNRIKEITGTEMNLFRAPYGDYNNMIIEVAEELDYYSIQWNIDSLDWKDYGRDSILKAVLDNKNLNNGSIILLHSGTKYTADTLEMLIHCLQDDGYKLVPVSQLIYTDNYYLNDKGIQFEKN